MGKAWGITGLAVCLMLVLIPAAWGDWLEISGEKGFSFEYNNGGATRFSGGLGEPFDFGQWLTLDVKGGLGTEIGLEGHLADQPNSPVQLFLALQGKQFGLQFGDHDLNAFSTALSGWKGEFNGLDGYYQNQRHRVQVVFANPATIPAQESLMLPTGHNNGFLTHRPLQEGSLRVVCDGIGLAEGLDYTVNYYTGELKLLFFPANPLRLDLSYQYVPDNILGNQLLAFQEQAAGEGYRLGVGYFGSQSPVQSGPFLLGESKSLPDLDLIEINGGLERSGWKWDLEYWVSRERMGELDWDFIDTMEGTRTESEAFADSTKPEQWSVWGTGSGILTLSSVTPIQDALHTRENHPSLVLDYRLRRTGDTVGISHDFGIYRDFSQVSKLSCWAYLDSSNLELELSVITSENNYYLGKFPARGVGWQCFDLDLDPGVLARMGAPDLHQIRYIRLDFRSPNGDERIGRLFVAPLLLEDESQAMRRWSLTGSAPGSSINVEAVAETVSGQSPENQVLQLEYTVPENGWASISYQPSLPLNLCGYRELRFYLNAPGAVRLSWWAIRGDREYPLGQLQATTGGFWQEYTLPLSGVADYLLERIETLKIKLDQVSGVGQLKLDAIRAAGRESRPAGALKSRGEYTSDNWRNLVEFNRVEGGFRDWAATHSQTGQSLRNLTEYIQDQWRVKSDLQVYRKADPVGGFPVAGRNLALEVQRRQTMVTLGVVADEAAEPEYGLDGNRVNSKLGIARQAGNWNFDFQRHWVTDDLTADTAGENEALQIRFAQGPWLGWTRLWRDITLTPGVQIRHSGSNLGLSFDPPGTNRWQIMGGTSVTDSGPERVNRNFGQSDLDWEPLRWLKLNGKLQFEAQPENMSGITDDYQKMLGVELLPVPGWNLKARQQSREWEQAGTQRWEQDIREYQLAYSRSEVEKAGMSLRREELISDSGATSGSRIGVYSESELKASWLTQVSAELNRSGNQADPASGRQENLTINLKNTRRQDEVTYYWGAWAERVRQSADLGQWNREMAQGGWETEGSHGWSLGFKLDLGCQTAEATPELIWGASGFATLNIPQTFFQVNLRYQTYSSPQWKIGLDCRIDRGTAYTVNWHTDYMLDPALGRDLVSRLDLSFYFH